MTTSVPLLPPFLFRTTRPPLVPAVYRAGFKLCRPCSLSPSAAKILSFPRPWDRPLRTPASLSPSPRHWPFGPLIPRNLCPSDQPPSPVETASAPLPFFDGPHRLVAGPLPLTCTPLTFHNHTNQRSHGGSTLSTLLLWSTMFCHARCSDERNPRRCVGDRS